MNPVREIMLVDDSESDNFIHTRIIKRAKVCSKLTVCYSGEEALDYLKTLINEDYPRPSLIFLDINMPGMNGWEFLEAYEKLENTQKADVVIAMLTTSTAPADREKAAQYDLLQHFNNKPLTNESLMSVLEEHFPKNFRES